MKLLLDIGNTHTAAALSTRGRVGKSLVFPTHQWPAQCPLQELIGKHNLTATACCSVVPVATKLAKSICPEPFSNLTHLNCGVTLDYPKPASIGPDRLANARAAIEEFGGPVLVVDFGTAVTFDIIDGSGSYVGGVIAPGLSAMTDYLHEKTALLPPIELRDHSTAIGKTTIQAMQIGAVHGYRGLVQGLIKEIRLSLGVKKLSVIATGGCANLIGRKIPEINAVRSRLTLDGLRLASNGWN